MPRLHLRKAPTIVAGHVPPGGSDLSLTPASAIIYLADCQKCRTLLGHFLWPLLPSNLGETCQRTTRPRKRAVANSYLTLSDLCKGYSPTPAQPGPAPRRMGTTHHGPPRASDRGASWRIRSAESTMLTLGSRPALVVGGAHPTPISARPTSLASASPSRGSAVPKVPVKSSTSTCGRCLRS